MSGLRRAAIVFGILTLLLWADGAYLIAKHTSLHGDSGVLFGNANDYLSAGTVVVLSGVLMFAVAAGMWCADVHLQDVKRAQRSAGGRATREQPGPSGRTASRAAAGDPAAGEPGPSGRTASAA